MTIEMAHIHLDICVSIITISVALIALTVVVCGGKYLNK